VAEVDSNLATAIRTGVILIFTWAFVWFSRATLGLATLNRRALLFLVLSGLATGLSWLCYFRALRLGEASRVARVDKVSVVLRSCWRTLFLGEKMAWHQWLGDGLMVAGAVVLAIKSA
jgi:bacterial/archaeal transporter family protein